MNGLGKWKIKHKDFIRVLESNDILSISETWMNQTESEIVSRDFSSTHKVVYVGNEIKKQKETLVESWYLLKTR